MYPTLKFPVQKEDTKHEPHGRKLRDNEEWYDFLNIKRIYEAHYEQYGVCDAIVNHTQTNDVDYGDQASNNDHIFAKSVEVIIEIGIRTPSSSLAKIMG